MPDREKIIKGIQECNLNGGLIGNCPYKGILLLLKEKESESKWIYGEDKTGVDGWYCSECNFFEPWFYEFTDDINFIRFYRHCPSCGRKMTSYTGKPTQTGG